MLLISTLLDSIVAAYQTVTQIVEAMDGEAAAIYKFSPERPESPSYDDILAKLPWPGLLVTHMSTELGYRGNMTQWRHVFRIDVKLGDLPDITYPFVQKWLVDGVPDSEGGLTIMQCSFDDRLDSLEAPIFTYQRDVSGKMFLRFELALQERNAEP